MPSRRILRRQEVSPLAGRGSTGYVPPAPQWVVDARMEEAKADKILVLLGVRSSAQFEQPPFLPVNLSGLTLLAKVSR